ncbi:hypothetical protein Q4E40_06740 [Pontibacter sp. BT731]|uniref:hypothetical protein n=1 Tax=Pontibacter coccineus TaxID=3063328 RepID=UPI0026E405D5|nr:hypothetical protein [Pontibacter sp. BT731]MDO6389817.1 hypothetical protein [Pontibacter sp. BT731]
MKQLILISSFALLFISCSKEKDTPVPPVLIDAYANRFMVDQHLGSFYTSFRFTTLAYKNGKVTSRVHGMECMQENTCDPQYTIVDDVTYGNNTIRISNRSGSSERDIRQQEWVFKLKNSNQLECLLRRLEDSKMHDSLLYVYSGNSKIKQIVNYSVNEYQSEKFAYKRSVKDFFFDALGNLEKVETRQLLDDGFVIKMITETFGNYDTAQNPFQGLFMFSDTFYRSLSENNFRKYTRQEKDMPNGILYDTQWNNWVLEYSAANVPLFDKL